MTLPDTFVGVDFLIEDAISPQGVHRQHVTRIGEMPDISHWKEQAGVPPEEIHFWLVKKGNQWHLWLAWKEPKADGKNVSK